MEKIKLYQKRNSAEIVRTAIQIVRENGLHLLQIFVLWIFLWEAMAYLFKVYRDQDSILRILILGEPELQSNYDTVPSTFLTTLLVKWRQIGMILVTWIGEFFILSFVYKLLDQYHSGRERLPEDLRSFFMQEGRKLFVVSMLISLGWNVLINAMEYILGLELCLLQLIVILLYLAGFPYLFVVGCAFLEEKKSLWKSFYRAKNLFRPHWRTACGIMLLTVIVAIFFGLIARIPFEVLAIWFPKPLYDTGFISVLGYVTTAFMGFASFYKFVTFTTLFLFYYTLIEHKEGKSLTEAIETI